MDHYKDYLIHATALGNDDHWEPRYALYNADGRPINPPKYRALLVHEKTFAVAVERAVAAGKKYIDEEM